MSKLQGEILTLPKMSGSISTPKTLSGTIGAKTINIGGKGDDGATFIPFVSADGVIFWTNDKDLPNPEPVNIKGAKGDKGDKGERGLQGIQGIQGERGEQGLKGDKGDRGEQGIQGTQGLKGETGEQGQKGADGTSVTHRWSGTTLYITSASGTSSANLKGEKGDPGANGKDGQNGYTPVRYIDYWTEADKAEIISSLCAVLYTEQELTEKQQEQAQKNIGVDVLFSKINTLTDEEVVVLSSMLENSLLQCNPAIEAVVAYTPGELDVSPFRWDVTATITGIDPSLIRKVEIGRAMKMAIVSYSFEEVPVTQTGDLTYICEKRYEELLGSSFQFAVRLTYYDAFGFTRELTVERVEA